MANNNDKFISRENAKTLWGYMIDLLTGKQNKLTFDEIPTQSSDNPVKSGGIFTALAGKGTYSKPQNGIPKTDLENAVQTSLGLADSALQSETDPTVPSWAKQTNKPSYTQDEVGDGTTYKRVNQTEKDTWSGKQNALSTTQMQAVNSGITSAGVAQISVNQTNILDSIKTGAKNIIVLPDGVYQPSSRTKFTVVDGAVTCETTASYTDAIYLPDFVIPAGTYGFYGTANNTGFQVRLYDTNNTRIDANPFTLNTDTTVRLAFYSLGAEASGTLTPMICLKSIYDQDSSYVKPAMTNRDLTVLESEDRTSLAEVVNSGAKNKLDYNAWKTVLVIGGTAVWENNGVTLTSTSPDCYTVYNPSLDSIPESMKIPVKQGDVLVMSWDYEVASGVTGTAYIFPNGVASGNVHAPITAKQLTYTVPSGVTYVTYRVGVDGAGKVAKWKNVMICSKTAWDVSPKFVSYRPPNNNLGYKTYEINLSAVTINKAGSGVYWYKISVSSDFSKVVSVSLTDGKEIPNKRSFMPYLENGTGGSQAIGFLIADPDAPATMTFNNGAYMSLTAFGYLK